MGRNNVVVMRSKLYFYLICKLLEKENDKYEKQGYLIKKEKKIIHITYAKNNYDIFIVKEDKNYYLKLVPYKTSYFKTGLNLKDIRLKVDMSLFAIKENK